MDLTTSKHLLGAAFTVLGFYLAVKEKDGWGWFVFAAIICI